MIKSREKERERKKNSFEFWVSRIRSECRRIQNGDEPFCVELNRHRTQDREICI